MADKHTPDMYKNHRQRLRRAAAENGAESLDNYKLLELLLFDALPRIDTYPLAHRLLDRFKTLDGVFSANKEELTAIEGVGPKTAAFIERLGALVTRSVLDEMTKAPLDSETAAFPVLLWLLRNAPTDTTLVVALDDNYGFIEYSLMPPGHDVKDYKKRIKRAGDAGAKRVIFAHKHPDRAPRPTPDDVKVTELLDEYCEKLGVILVGHYIVVGGKKIVSVITDEYLKDKYGK